MSAFERSWNLLKVRTEADDQTRDRPASRWEQRHFFVDDLEGAHPPSTPAHDPKSIPSNYDLAMHRAMLGPRRSRTHRMNQMGDFAEHGITPTFSQHNLEQGRGHTYPDEPQTQMDTFRERYADATDEEGEPLDVSQMDANAMLAYLDRMRHHDEVPEY